MAPKEVGNNIREGPITDSSGSEEDSYDSEEEDDRFREGIICRPSSTSLSKEGEEKDVNGGQEVPKSSGSSEVVHTNGIEEVSGSSLKEGSYSDKISTLEAENINLRRQLELLSVANNEKEAQRSVARNSKLDPSLLDFIEQHEELTLDSLKQALQFMNEINAIGDEPLKKMAQIRKEYEIELTELRLSNKKLELKLKEMHRRYEEELTSSSEDKIDHILKTGGAREYVHKNSISKCLQQFRDNSKRKDETIDNLKGRIEMLQSEVTDWKSKFLEAEKQCSNYYQKLRELQMKEQELEAKNKAKQERERNSMMAIMNSHYQNQPQLDMSSASSIIDTSIPPPPPPPIEVPRELMRFVGGANQSVASPESNSSFNLSQLNNHVRANIPQAPQLESISFEELMGNSKASRSTANSLLGEASSQKVKVQGRYGTVFNSRPGGLAQ